MISYYLRDRLLDQVLRGAAFEVGRVWLSLHSADPDGSGRSEIAGVPRVLGRFEPATLGAASNAQEVVWDNLPAATVTHVGVWDAQAGGNFLWGGPLAISRRFPDPGFRLIFDPGDFTVKFID